MATAGAVTGTALVATTTTGTVFVTQLSVTTTLLAGTYIVFASCATASNTANRYSDVQLTVDGTAISVNWVNHVVANSLSMTNFMEIGALTAGSHTIQLQYRRSPTNALNTTIACSDANIVAVKIL